MQTKQLRITLVAAAVAMMCPALCQASAPQQWITQLDNGMQVIIIEDHSSPLAASIVNIRAGSATETRSTNGLSHLVEHMLFNGTANRTGEELKSEVPALGGYINAYTRKDYAAYEIVMPAEYFTDGLEIQADQILNSILPDDELDREKKVVCEEIAQDIRNASAAADAAAMETLFGPTGYGLPTIGNYETVNAANREQAVSFYTSRYVPNRMTAVIVGSVNPQQVLKTLRELYEPVQPGLGSPGPIQVPRFPPDGLRKVLSRDVNGDAVVMVLPAPAITDSSWFAFQIALYLWANAPDGPLQERISPLARSATAYVTPYDGFSLVTVSIRPLEKNDGMTSKKTLEQMESALLESIQAFISFGADQQQVARRIRSARVDHEFSRERANHLARDIGSLAALNALDNYWSFDERIRSVTAEQVNYVFAEWLGDVKPVAVMIQPDDSKEDPAETTPADEPVTRTLDNGLTVISLYDPYADLAAINLLIRNSMSEYPGIPRIVAELLNTGTRSMTREELDNALTDLGIRTKLADWPWLPFDNYYDSIEYNYLQMECLSENIGVAMDLFGQMVFDSVIPDDAWQDLTEYMRMLAGNAERSASGQSGRLLSRILFASEFHQQPRLPLMKDISNITTETLRNYYQKAYQPSEAIVSVTGNVRPETVLKYAEKYLSAYSSLPADEPPEALLNEPRRGFISVDDPVASVRAALPLEITPETLPVWSVIAAILSDKLQEEIRYRRGRAYRLGAALNEMYGLTYLAIGVGTRGENLAEVEEATREIVDDISGMTFDSQTVSAAVNSLRGREWRYRQRRINRAYFLAWRHWLGYGIDYERSWADLIGEVTVEAVNQAMTSLKSADQWFWAVAGQETAENESEELQSEMSADHGY
jgi:zinc protease